MDELIRRGDVLALSYPSGEWNTGTQRFDLQVVEASDIEDIPAIDAVEVVRCKDCIYFREEHVLTPDGQRKSYSEMPPEAFGGFSKINSVTSSYGINIGSQCLVDCNRGYGEDKTVFRRPDDYCSRGVRRDSDG